MLFVYNNKYMLAYLISGVVSAKRGSRKAFQNNQQFE